MTAAVRIVVEDTQSIWLIVSTITTTLIVTLGGIAVAVINSRGKRLEKHAESIVEQLKTTNGSTVGEYVEQIAQDTKGA